MSFKKMGVFPAGVGGLTIIVSEPVMEQVMGYEEIANFQTKLFLKSTDLMATQHEIEDMGIKLTVICGL